MAGQRRTGQNDWTTLTGWTEVGFGLGCKAPSPTTCYCDTVVGLLSAMRLIINRRKRLGRKMEGLLHRSGGVSVEGLQ